MNTPEPTVEMRAECARLQRMVRLLDRRLALTNRLACLLTASYDQHELLARGLEAIADAIGVQASSVLLYDEKDESLHFVAATGPAAERVKEFTLEVGKGVAGWCFEHSEAVVVSDVNSDERFHREISESLGFPTHSLLCAPLRVQGSVIGVIELVNKTGDNDFIPEDIETVTSAAHILGLLVENAIWVRALQQGE